MIGEGNQERLVAQKMVKNAGEEFWIGGCVSKHRWSDAGKCEEMAQRLWLVRKEAQGVDRQ